MSYFEILNLPVAFSQDLETIDANYQKIQSIVHPDVLSSKSTNDNLGALNYSSMINLAYKTIKHPVSRAEYLYEVLFSKKIGANQFMDLNMETLDLREEFETMDSKEQIENFITKLKLVYNDCIKDVSVAFATDLDEIKCDRAVQRLKFMYKLLNVAKEKIE